MGTKLRSMVAVLLSVGGLLPGPLAFADFEHREQRRQRAREWSEHRSNLDRVCDSARRARDSQLDNLMRLRRQLDRDTERAHDQADAFQGPRRERARAHRSADDQRRTNLDELARHAEVAQSQYEESCR